MSLHPYLPATPIVVPLLIAAFLAALNRHIPRWLADSCAIFSALYACAASLILLLESADHPIVYWFGGWMPRAGVALGISFTIDPFGAGLAAFAALLVLLALIFSIHYFDSVGTIFHVLMLAFLAAMCGFCLTGDVFNLFVWFELMSASAFALCGYKTEEAGPIQGSLNFAITNTIGAFIVLSGIGLLYGRTGALNMAQIGRSLGVAHHADALVLVAFVMIMTGFLVKAAIFPFHFWLDDAHAVAPTPVCILFSGIMVELGLYAVARLYWTIFQSSFSPQTSHIRAILIALGVITALLGAVMSFAQRHIKRLLAYSTVSHMGLLLIGFALLTPRALAGAAIYLLGHGAYKSALFVAAGLLLHRLGSVDELKLHDRGKEIGGKAWVIVLIALGLAGIPPYATFIGEALIDDSAGKFGYAWISYIFIAAAIITAGAVLRVIGHVFLGWGPVEDKAGSSEGETDEGKETGGDDHKIPITMYGPLIFLLLFGIAIPFIPQLRAHAERVAMRFQDQSNYAAQVLDQAPLPAYSPAPQKSLVTGGIRAGVATMGALLLALITLFRKRIPGMGRLNIAKGLEWAVNPLRAIHSGAIGDYVTWLAFGVAAIGGLFAWLAR